MTSPRVNAAILWLGLISIILVICVSAVLLFLSLRKPRLVHVGAYRLASIDKTSAFDNRSWRPSLWPGCVANWNGQIVYVTSEMYCALVRSVIDGAVLEKIPAYISWPSPNVQLIADGPRLYILFYEGNKGPCIARCERGRAPEVTALFPANTFNSQGKWITLPDREAILTWRSSGFQLREDGSLEGLAGVFRYKEGEYYIDPEEEITADFWFHYKDGVVKYSRVGEHVGVPSFRLVPSTEGYPSGLLSGFGDTLYYREIKLDKDGKPLVGTEKRLDFNPLEASNVEDFELVPPAANDAGELKVLLRTYITREGDANTSQDVSGDYEWKLAIIDRATFKESDVKALTGFSSFERIRDDYSSITTRQGRWVTILGYVEDYSKDYVLAFDVDNLKGYVLKVRNRSSLADIGLFPYSNGQVGIGYRQWDEENSLPKNVLDLYKLILPQ